MNSSQLRPVAFRFCFGDWVLFTRMLPMQVRTERALDPGAAVDSPELPVEELLPESQGFCLRSVPIARQQPALCDDGEYIRYIPLQYQHCYVDLSGSFEQYARKFSSKTRSTIQRKIKKYREHCNGTIRWKCYVDAAEIEDFFGLAREVSKLTYQERLLDVGIPNTDSFLREAIQLAESNNLRAFILFDGERPVAYLYCPVYDGVAIYAYLGYDPKYGRMSVGTVLQWLALESMFGEGRFRYFDFTEGQSEHKKLFSTHQQLCANVFFVRRTLRNVLLIRAHRSTDKASNVTGRILERVGLKSRIRRLLRRG